ncbi:hypothetical protein C4D60_Mb03t19630 [Musa balbisiana]|uniref:Uncharacterized protein n=1 Tax=Musa balbisiana TaxID=52838 RepID=A0A4V4H681_MUSBA|nr:hypothetical protein C4D60_Mb03t19630 [Musa balbisiana]
MRDLCLVHSHAEGEQYQALSMVDLPAGESGTPYASWWLSLKDDNRIWVDRPIAQEFIRGALHPAMAKELYYSSSELLMDRAAKLFIWGKHYSMALIDRVWDARRVIEHLSDSNFTLRMEILELKAGMGPKVVVAAEQCALALDEEMNHLKAELEESWARARMFDDELQPLSRDVEFARSSA